MKKGREFLFFLISHRNQPAGTYPVRNFSAQVIDANHMARLKPASLLSQEKTAFRISSRRWQGHAQEKVYQQQPSVIAVFQTGTAAGSSLIPVAGRANGTQSQCRRLPLRVGESCAKSEEMFCDFPVFFEPASDPAVATFRPGDFLPDRAGKKNLNAAATLRLLTSSVFPLRVSSVHSLPSFRNPSALARVPSTGGPQDR